MKRLFLMAFLCLFLCTGIAHGQASATGASATLQNAATATGNGASLSTERWGAVRVKVTISATATVTFEVAADGTNFTTTSNAFNITDPSTSVSTATATGSFIIITNGAPFRARISSYGSGTVTVVARQIYVTVAKAIGGGGGLPALGNALEVLRVNAGGTGLEYVALAGGGDALVGDPLSQFAATTSAQLRGVLSDESGTGVALFANGALGAATATSINKVTITAPATAATLTIADGKTLTASNTLTFTGTDTSSVAFGAGGTVLYSGGALGTPSSGTLTNATGLPIAGITGLGANVGTWLATPSSANLAAAVTGETGTDALVFANTPTLVTPVIGAATGTSLVLSGALTSNALTSGRVPVAGASGILGDDADLTFATDTLTATKIAATTSLTVAGAAVTNNVVQNSQSAAYTTVLSDAGKHILHPTADNNARTFTIDSNANVAYPIGTCITFVNQINTVTISITSDTLVLAGPGTTGSRTLAANGIATAIKISATVWIISGTGLT